MLTSSSATSGVRRAAYYLKRHEDEAGAAFEWRRQVSRRVPTSEFDELRASLLEEPIGKTLVGKQLDFYRPARV